MADRFAESAPAGWNPRRPPSHHRGRRRRRTNAAAEEEGSMTRAELTEKIVAIKRKKGLTWTGICAELGPGSPVYYTAALLGQMKLKPDEAKSAARILGLDADEELLL